MLCSIVTPQVRTKGTCFNTLQLEKVVVWAKGPIILQSAVYYLPTKTRRLEDLTYKMEGQPPKKRSTVGF